MASTLARNGSKPPYSAPEGSSGRHPVTVPRMPLETDPLLGTPPVADQCDEEQLQVPRALFWQEFKLLATYTAPIFGTQLLEYSFQISSVVSIGHLSTTALAAATLASMTASVTGFSITQGLCSSLDTLLPSSWTSGNPEFMGLWSQRLTVIIFITNVPVLVLWFNAEPILLSLRQEPEVAHLAAVYLKWLSLALPAYGLSNVLRRYFQAQGLFDAPTKIVILVAPINALLNYLLVWGPEPLRLGFIGAPLATSISYNLITVLSIVYGVWLAPDHRAWHPISRRSFQNLGLVTWLGLAGVGQIASEWWSWELVGLAASQLGPLTLATQSILLVSASTTFQAPYSIAIAASVQIGNLLGEGKAQHAGVSSRASLVLTLFVAAMTSSIYLVFRHRWASLFNDDREVGAMVAHVLPLVAAFQIFDGLDGVASGILRARGMQGTGALINLSAYYGLGIPIGVFLAFKANQGLKGLWEGLTLSLIYGSAVGLWIVLRTDWNQEVCKVRERLEKDRKATSALVVHP